MSKMDALRAMREARYEQTAARAAPPTGAATKAAKRATATPARARRPAATPQPPAEGTAEPLDEGLCGHRAISGRTCTRERNHAAKSHRYA